MFLKFVPSETNKYLTAFSVFQNTFPNRAGELNSFLGILYIFDFIQKNISFISIFSQ